VTVDRPLPVNYYAHAGGGIKRYRDPSICVSHGAAALGYRHAGCLQLSHVRTADPSADGRTSATSGTLFGGGMLSRHLWAITCYLLVSSSLLWPGVVGLVVGASYLRLEGHALSLSYRFTINLGQVVNVHVFLLSSSIIC